MLVSTSMDLAEFKYDIILRDGQVLTAERWMILLQSGKKEVEGEIYTLTRRIEAVPPPPPPNQAASLGYPALPTSVSRKPEWRGSVAGPRSEAGGGFAETVVTADLDDGTQSVRQSAGERVRIRVVSNVKHTVTSITDRSHSNRICCTIPGVHMVQARRGIAMTVPEATVPSYLAAAAAKETL